jgi:flagellar hook-basal body complex protein FliE
MRSRAGIDMSVGATGQALAAYRAAAGDINSGAAPIGGMAAGGGFDNLLKAELQQAVGALQRSEQASIAGITGKASIQEVVEAVTAAELTLQKVTAVRDRVITAYQEIMRMPI